MKTQLGLDYASVDANALPDFDAAKTAGVSFVIIRKMYVLHNPQNNTWRLASDPCFARDAARAREAGLVVGAYGFLSFAKNGPSAAEQVAQLVSGGSVHRGQDLPYVLDVEFPGGLARTGRSKAEVFAVLLEMVAEVRRQGGVSPMIYTSHVQWSDELGGPDAHALDDCPLWIKTPYRLRERQAMDQQKPRAPHVGAAGDDHADLWRVPLPWERQGWWLQQFQGDALHVPGFDQTVDVNLYAEIDPNDAPRIRWAQRHLCVVGLPDQGPLQECGKWDADTQHALEAFQMANNVGERGQLDVATFASLAWRH